LVVLYLGSTLLWTVIASSSEHGWAGAVLDGALYVAALASGYAAYRWDTAGIWLLATTVALGLILHLHTAFSGTSLFFLAVWLAPFRVRLWHAMVLTAVTTAGFAGTSMAMSLADQAIFGIGFALGWAGFLAAVVNQLVVTRKQTKAVAQAQARAAVLGERQRLAREIHDILAHSLSAQVVHLEGARLLLEQGGDRDMILDRVVRAGDLARAGLADSKRAVSALRGDQTPLVEQLELLAGQFRSTTGRSCEVTVAGDAGRLAPEAWLAVVRTAQEALTNAHKHASGADVELTLEYEPSLVKLTVTDNGTEQGAGDGMGLAGMRERAVLLGGTLFAGREGPGWTVRMELPR